MFGVVAGCLFLNPACTPKEKEYSVAAVSLDKNVLYLTTQDTATLICAVKPDLAKDKRVKWSSSNTDIAEVSQNGLVTSFDTEGKTIITVTSIDGGKKDTCAVIVSNQVRAVEVSPKTLNLLKDAAYTLTAQVVPANATGDKTVTWSSTNTSVATVNGSGKVTGVNEGEAKIVVKTNTGGFTDTCYVSVTLTAEVSVTDVSVTPTSLSLVKDQAEQLTAVVSPANASFKEVEWTTSSAAVATVSTSGLVTAIAQGSATITARTIDGSKTATCAVMVDYTPVSSITLNETNLSLTGKNSAGNGETFALTAAIMPASANPSITWSSNNSSIASVDAAGMVTSNSRGTAVITATATGGVTATCTVKVVDAYALYQNAGTCVVGKNDGMSYLWGVGSGADFDVSSTGFVRIAGSVGSGGSISGVALWSGTSSPLTLTNLPADGGYGSAYGICQGTTYTYVAGYTYQSVAPFTRKAVVWRNSVIFANITNGSYEATAYSVVEEGSFIFAAGYEKNASGKKVAKVWSITSGGTVATSVLTNGANDAEAQKVFVPSSGAIYAAGFDGTTTRVWKDGSFLGHTYPSGDVKYLYVSGSDVYVLVGNKMHKNGTVIYPTSSNVVSMYVLGADVYYTLNDGCLYKNGEKAGNRTLSNSSIIKMIVFE